MFLYLSLFNRGDRNNHGVFTNYEYAKDFEESLQVLFALLRRNRNAKLSKFANAFAENATAQWRRSKLLVVGKPGSGKTSTIRSMLRSSNSSRFDFDRAKAEDEAVTGQRIEVLHCRQTEDGLVFPETSADDYVSDLAHRIVSRRMDVENAENRQALANVKAEEKRSQRQKTLIRPFSMRFAKSTRSLSTTSIRSDHTQPRARESARSRFNRRLTRTPARRILSNIDEPGNESGDEEEVEFVAVDVEPNLDVDGEDKEEDEVDRNGGGLGEGEGEEEKQEEPDGEEEEEDGIEQTGEEVLEEYPVTLSMLDPLNASYSLSEEKLISARKSEDQGELHMAIWDFTRRNSKAIVHDLFLTDIGVYLVVFNASELVHSQAELDALQAWIQALIVQAPLAQLVLVGAFAEELTEDDALVIDSKLKAHCDHPGLTCNDTTGHLFYGVCNVSGSGVDALRRVVRKLSEKQAFVEEQVPLHWMICLEWLKSQKNYARKEEFQTMAASYGINSTKVEDMLRMFHQVGAVQYFHANTVLSTMIVTDPNWLVSQLCNVIRDLDPRADPSFASELAHLKSIVLLRDVKRLRAEGIASRDLLQYLWRGQPAEFLMEAMQHLMLMSRWKYEEDAYLIPQMISEAAPIMHDPSEAGCTVEFKILPPGVFERFVCLCVEFLTQQSEEIPRLYRGCLDISLMSSSADKKLDLRIQHQVEKHAISMFCTQFNDGEFLAVVEEMRTMLRKITQDFKGSNFTWKVFVREADGEGETRMISLDKARSRQKGMRQTRARTGIDLDGFLSS